MKSVIKSFIFSFIMIASLASCAALPAGASRNGRNQVVVEDENPQGLDFCLLNDETYGVAVGTAYGLSYINIPEYYQDREVTRIMDVGFVMPYPNYSPSNCCKVEKIEFPNTIISIGDSAFYCCKNLTNVRLPSFLEAIEDYAFCACDNLRSVYIPYSVSYIGNSAFSGCSPDCVIYCEAPSMPSGWMTNWVNSSIQVVWGYSM